MQHGDSLATPRGYTIEAFCAAFGLGRTSAFGEIKGGRLKARKVGRRTIILATDAETWAASLPERAV
ncbi:DNA-binding protein [Mesorhizobium sp. AR10]|uniref:DNA-binding protein n=1 Tax=Mesorhizobium sp. AR10 TaxID=2865839 RepID=UPI002160D0D5|nr:DNA-binding protein [Mesorhizobium sp. AR10]